MIYVGFDENRVALHLSGPDGSPEITYLLDPQAARLISATMEVYADYVDRIKKEKEDALDRPTQPQAH